MQTSTPEQIAPPNFETLPVGDALRGYYALEFSAIDLPTSYRMAEGAEREDIAIPPNVNISNTPEDIRSLQGEFLRNVPDSAIRASWWVSGNRYVKSSVEGVDSIADMPVIAKHHLGITAHGEKTDQGYDVIELGEPEDPATVEVVFDTLKLIDQLSGGMIAAQSKGMRVGLLRGVTMNALGSRAGEKGGFAFEGGVVINTDGLRRWKGVTDENFHELLAAMTVHEVLGHGLEQATKGSTGSYYDQQFLYSDYTPGELFDDVASSVEARDPAAPDSKPVREYGRVNASEDFATSVDGSVAHAMGWSEKISGVKRAASTTDPHRRDLVIGLMDQAAKMAKAYDHTPGVVGSELHYNFDTDGNLTGIEPVRSMEITSLYGSEAVQDELRWVVKRCTPKGEFLIGNGDYV